METREIKFRGQCAISKEMVFGDLIHGVSHKAGNLYILPNQHNLAYVKHCDPLDGVRVIPETVGQYIRKDRNGNDIYEDDVIRYRGGRKPRNGERGFLNSVVVFKNNTFTIKENKSIFNDFAVLIHAEVIGNIHENPELLTPNN